MMATSVATVLLEYSLCIGLWFPRTHKWLLPLGVLFHLSLYYFLPVNTFSLTVILLYLVFLNPETVHSWMDEMLGYFPKASAKAS